MNISELKTAHFIGIGGIGISALARLLLHEGKKISGTNDSESVQTLDALREQGVAVSLDTNPEVLTEADCYIYSDAWLSNFPAVIEAAKATGRPTLSYFEALGEIANRYHLIAVTGTHGKTTTTAMTTDILETAGLDPTAVIGSLRAKTKSNFRGGQSKYFVVEADEYRRHLLNFSPEVLVITNIEADHLDYYEDLADVQSAFKALAEKVPEDGYIVCNPKDPNIVPVIEGANATILDYTKYVDPLLELRVPGEHNLMNAAAAMAAAETVGVKKEQAKEALKEFAGTWRRFEYKGEVNGAKVYDDYAHHPTEIQATVAAARTLKPERVIVVFQPHMYSRTAALFDDFARALAGANEVLLAPIYAAREENESGVTSERLAKAVTKAGGRADAYETFTDIEKAVREEAGTGDVVLVLGAGDITELTTQLTT